MLRSVSSTMAQILRLSGVARRANIQIFPDRAILAGVNGTSGAVPRCLNSNEIVHGRLDAGVQLVTKPFSYAEPAGHLPDVPNTQATPPRVLVVEDEVLIQMVATDILEDLGFKAEVAGTAAAAKSKLALLRGDVAAAIVDIGLPDANGDVLVNELRALYPALPIVVASGHSESAVSERFKKYEKLGYLAKPYSVEQLVSTLRAIGVLT
jgi:CheY-like chemotaxis protein